MSRSWKVAAAALYALLALQWLWRFAERDASARLQWWLLALLYSLPLLPPAIAFLRRRPRAGLWAGIVALLYFCLGVTEVRVGSAGWALVEVAFSLLVIFAGSWPGLHAKLLRRKPKLPPPTV